VSEVRDASAWRNAGHIPLPPSVIVVRPHKAANATGEGDRMKIKLTSVYVDDQEKALRFYTEVLGFIKKADFSQGPFRWLTVASPEETEGAELQLALNDNPAARAYQQAIFQQGQPATMFFTDDINTDYERIKARGGEFTMPPTAVTGSTIAMLNDTCGNLIQLTQLARH
jgi:predicted enzyme related to lactoylglutathione lyase